MQRWEHQSKGVKEINGAIARDEKRIVWGSATGTGKSVVMQDLAHGWVNAGIPTVLLTNRRFLFDQLVTGFKKSGLPTRTIASGWEDEGRQLFTACMFQTLATRNIAPPARRVLFDECHNETGPSAENMIAEYVKHDAHCVGITATPLGCNHIYDHLILGADRSDGRECGALVMAQCFGCGQLDVSGIGRQQSGEYSSGDVTKKVYHSHVYGHVVREHKKINPDHRPTILFAPGKDESVFFVDEFEKHGITAASITSDGIYWGGETIPATPSNRQLIKDAVRKGIIEVLCNRFILREGIDIPELSHCILACPFGSILSYTQSVGRVLRYHKDLPEIDFGPYGGKQKAVTIQDHGGNFWRHGSPNEDLNHTWDRYFDGKVKCVTDDREEMIRDSMADKDKPDEKEEKLPSECPACGAIQFYFKNKRCYRCNNEIFGPGIRRVIQTNGNLKELHCMHEVKPRRKKDTSSDEEKAWKKAFFTARHMGYTFGNARQYATSGRIKRFEHLKGKELPWDLPYMPKNKEHWKRPANSLGPDDLHGDNLFGGKK